MVFFGEIVEHMRSQEVQLLPITPGPLRWASDPIGISCLDKYGIRSIFWWLDMLFKPS